MRLPGCSALLLAALSTAGAQSREQRIKEYIAAREVYQRSFDSLWRDSELRRVMPSEAMAVDSAWVRQQTPILRQLIEPLRMPGLADTGTIRIGAMQGAYDNDPVPDAIVYRTSDGVDIIASDTALLYAWAVQTRNGRFLNLDSVLVSEHMLASGFVTGAAVSRYVDLAPLLSPGKRVVKAVLVNYAQDDCPQCSPRTLLVAIRAGRRVLIAQQEIPDSIPVPEKCQQTARDYWRMNPNSNPSDDEAMTRVRRCYAGEVKTDPRLKAIRARAQALVDRLPGLPRHDLEKLQGIWRVADARARMSNEPAMIIDGLVDRGTIEFSANAVTMRQLPHADLASFTFTLDTLASPRRLRMIDTTAADSARWTGIYRITGDTLRLSLPISHSSDNPVPPAGFNAPNTAAYLFRREPP